MLPALGVLLGLLLAPGAPPPAAPPAPPPATPVIPATPPAVPPSPVVYAHPLRATATAMGANIELEVRDLTQAGAQAAMEAAIAEMAEIERLTAVVRPDGALAALNAAAGKGPRPADPRLLGALAKARDFCLWSEGKNGPLGRDLNSCWGVGAAEPPKTEPAADLVERAVAAAACGRLAIDEKKGTVTLEAGGGLDLSDFAIGLAVDRAVEVLRQHGARNGFIQIGAVRRGFGAGRDGQGWLVELPAMAGLDSPVGRVVLHDQALAVASRADHPLEIGGQTYSRYINQRTGRPSEGVLVTIAVTELAIDAQAMAATLTVTGAQEGEMLMGSVRPRPSVLWLLGSGFGLPLLVEYRWSEVLKH
ncbi:MAG TPA: FAD:protein FMN transferase [Thermoanaerobaculia bacterium]|nr:FAD:protein FMN transferase [Thermoanaerobaculia bacterium]